MNGIYYIKVTVDEWNSEIIAYFATEEEAREALKECNNWYRPKGTGSIYFQPFGLNQKFSQLVYENY